MLTFEKNSLKIAGDIVIDNVRVLLEDGRGYCVADDVTVDFSGADDVDSSALALILEYRRAAQSAGKRLRVSNLPANLNTLAELYGVTDLIATTP